MIIKYALILLIMFVFKLNLSQNQAKTVCYNCIEYQSTSQDIWIGIPNRLLKIHKNIVFRLIIEIKGPQLKQQMCPFLNAVRILILWFIIMAVFLKKNEGKRLAQMTWTCFDKLGTILSTIHQRCII